MKKKRKLFPQTRQLQTLEASQKSQKKKEKPKTKNRCVPKLFFRPEENDKQNEKERRK